MKILPAITTTKGSDWRAKIEEAKKIGLKEVCFFLTCLDFEQRKEFYKLAKNTGVKKVPFMHIRNDMEIWELDYFVKNYKTKAFNIHCDLKYPLINNYLKYKNIIFIENIHNIIDKKDLEKFAGICLDFAHLEDDRLMDEKKFKKVLKLLEKYPIGCNHISAVSAKKYTDQYGSFCHSKHFYENPSEFDYLKNYPKKYFSNYIALELENTLEEQLKAKDYILEILSKIC